ncbi:bifunctional 23S rRNA (guanine(2069)-N(7))-methyltransferase RlmK/23S rRNA (guanine(2445)-N(2))-methyltransferase RlmL [Colwellia sp. E2M01]|uniref:bifunctional 23S rRNA (guanine(2069)-N(7))-methyltransferase RlmK/23S rRNA (guanine(2445)-N(2))-methyltransferase RlmL n=1 Tax=Colwellia sp. E2M01 TaxID=2841561 RepID=UPI001C09BCDF|nr:bifunctional 23S rRNA (guanine(2069)-N(7))-methyltransferase RlmK/23S rRNA (guanine(2445)-N(2))-methyltransferase RlmL [Colwellia sp. E2M01]MBU2869754.1 bifunctional 23S rRNA (guanine(2069)-N(7))-methyltransferase RlmK/23S rRNA (guanine(2445)-N(2))-methyltransferase RlmL [Colwellia sp. E2M01]
MKESMQQFLALTSPGIEVLLFDEIKSLGGEQVVQKPEGVYFQASLDLGYKISLWTRLATRIMLKLGEGEAKDKGELFKAASSINWPEVFNPTTTFAIDFVGYSEEIRNSQFGGLTIKDAIVDQFRDQGFERPNVDKQSPQISFQARLLRDHVSIYLDFSGRGLFQRGYREHSGAAPLKENLAAALIIRSGWLTDTSKPLVDPMCGSGTILIEAVAMAAKQAPSINRSSWGFESWLSHDNELWQEQLTQAIESSEKSLTNLKVKVFGIDLDGRVLKTAQQNARNAGLQQFIEFTCKNTNDMNNVYGPPGTILFNPPYGERIGELPELVENFVLFGQKLKSQFMDWRIAILTANIDLLAMLKLSSFKRYKFKNGPLDCQLALYNVDAKQKEKDAVNPQSDFSEEDSAFANRLKKNRKTLKGWLKSGGIEAYRIYDGDIPEYNAAVDIYGDYLVIQEYAAPKTIDEDKAKKRLQEVIYWAPKVLEIPTDKVILKTRAKQKGSNQYQRMDKSKQSLTINEHGALFKINLWDYLDTGLFLDHRKTRQIVAKKAKGKSLLNLFAYTGSVSVQAAVHGASSITTVDMSNTYLNWAQDNFALNKLSSHKYQFIQADCLDWLKKSTDKFDIIFIDPPTFSNSKRMEDSFDVQRDHVDLITDALKSLNRGGEIFFTNNKRNFKIDFEALAELGLKAEAMSDITRDKDFARNKHIHNSWSIKRSAN